MLSILKTAPVLATLGRLMHHNLKICNTPRQGVLYHLWAAFAIEHYVRGLLFLYLFSHNMNEERTDTMKQLRCALYPRVSTEEQFVNGLSLDAQRKDLTDYANRMGYLIVGVYPDEGISARKPVSKRPAILSWTIRPKWCIVQHISSLWGVPEGINFETLCRENEKHHYNDKWLNFMCMQGDIKKNL